MHFSKPRLLVCLTASLCACTAPLAAPADPALRTDEVRLRHNPDGTTTLQGRLHQGMGPMFNLTIPDVRPKVYRKTDPSGVDANGNPVNIYQKGSREIILKSASDMIRQGLVKPNAGPKKDQLKIWQEKNEAARKYQEEHGRITTKTFIHPGTTPEQSRLINAPDTALVIDQNGKRHYVNERLQQARAQAESAVFECGTCQIDKPAPKEASTTERISDTTMVLHRKARGLNIQEMQNPQEVDLKALFPDMDMTQPTPEIGKPISKMNPFPNPRPGQPQRKSPGKTKLAEIVLNRLVPAAYAQETQPSDTSQNPKQDLEASKSSTEISEAEKDKTPLRFFGSDDNKTVGIEYSEEQKKRLDDFFAEGLLLQRDAENIRRRATVDKPVDGDRHQARDNHSAQQPINPSVRREEDILAAVEIAKQKVDPEQYAKFEAQSARFADELLSAQSISKFADVLRELVDAYPEVTKAVPDIDARINALEGKDADGKPLAETDKRQTYVFISQSLGKETLKGIFEQHQYRSDIVYVLIGVEKDAGIADGIRGIQQFASQFETRPHIVIDPVLFETYGITRVPSVVVARSTPYAVGSVNKRQTGKLIAKATGLADDRWVKDQIEAGETGDLGIRGQTWDISEVNMLALMKKRIAEVDWKAKRDAALKNFWKNRQFDVLPTAEKSRTRIIDPTIYVEKDIKDLAGRYIRRAGDKVNPLEIRPFTRVLLVFNGSSTSEVDRLSDYLKEKAKSDKNFRARARFIVTSLDKTRGWDAYTELADRFDAHIQFLMPEIKERWQIEKTPAIVYADNDAKHFVVEELGPSAVAAQPENVKLNQ